MRLMLVALLLQALSLAAHAGQTIVERVDPIDLRWGEVSLASGSSVTLPAPEPGQPQPAIPKLTEYPFLWRVEFTEGRRTNKTPGLSGDKAVINERFRTVGSFLIAANFSEGREHAKLYARELAANAQKIDLPSLEKNFSMPTGLIEAALQSVEGNSQLFFCVDTGEYNATNGVVTRSGGTSTATVTSGADRNCEMLRRNAANAVEFARFRLGYDILASVVETVSVDQRDQLDQPAIEWPALVTRKETAADPASGWFSSVSNQSGESISTETLPLTDEEMAAGRSDPSRVLELRLKDGAMPPAFARSRGVILRFEGSRTERKLGAMPKELAREQWSTIIALMLSTAEGGLQTETFIDLAGAEWTAHAGPLSPQAFLDATHNAGRSLGRRDLMAIYCPSDPGKPPGARYCIRNACAEITNGAEFCDALEKEFYRR